MIIPVFNEYRRLNFTVDVAIWIRLGLILYGIYRQIPGSSETTRKRKKSVFFNSRSLPPLSSYPIICYLFSYSSPRQMEFLWGGSKNGGYMSEECASNASDHYWFRERTFEAAKLLLLWGRPFLYRYASVQLTVTELPIKSEGKHLAGLWVKTRKP